MVILPYYSHIFRPSYGSHSMGPAYHKEDQKTPRITVLGLRFVKNREKPDGGFGNERLVVCVGKTTGSRD